jgi:hypothetical protein
MKKVFFCFLVFIYSCSPSTKSEEKIKKMEPFDYLLESGRWSRVSFYYMEKRMSYVGKVMTAEDNRKYREYEVLNNMAADSAKFYMDKYDIIVRSDSLKKKYYEIVRLDSINMSK